MVFDKISHNRTADAVIDRLERLILNGILRAGDRLPSERELALELDVSRPILREALGELEARGLIVSRHGEGTFLADIVGAVFSEPLVALIQRHGEAVADYFEFRREIEGWSARLAAERATEGDHALIRQVVAAMDEAHERGDAEAEASLDLDLHMRVGEAAHNIVLMHTLRSCYRLMADGVFTHRARMFDRPHLRDALLAQHRAIAEAILAGDATRAERAAVDHVDFVERTTREVERSEDRAQTALLRLELYERARQRGRRSGSKELAPPVEIHSAQTEANDRP